MSMQAPDRDEVLEIIATHRRETRSLRRWAVFTAVCAGISLFFPGLAAVIADRTARLLDVLGAAQLLAPVFGLLAVFCVAAYVVSHFADRSGPEQRV
ncbi:MAG: hypothetical protein EOO38_04125, partial [Cytophagaceae bacterium]